MRDTELQQLLDDTAQSLGVVGAQLAVYDGERLREFATGYRDRELGLPVTFNTLFQIGSTTKVFNAALILSLVDAGRLTLDTPVQNFIRDFRLADLEAQRSITLRHLLSMSSGLDNGPYYDFGRGEDALGRYVDSLAGLPQLFAPGTAYGYSNAGTNVAGHAAARVMGQTWEGLLTQRLLAPLGLQHFALFAEDLLLHPVALGYKKDRSHAAVECMPAWNTPRSMGPSGGLTCCSAGDLVRLARMFLDHGQSIDGTRVLSEEAVAAMHEPQVKLPTRFTADEWCLGPYRKQWGRRVLYGHYGTNYGGSSMLLWCPEMNIAVSTVVNVAEQGYPLADALLAALCPRLFGIEKPALITRDTAVPVKTDPRPYVGRFESFGMIQAVSLEGEKLFLAASMAVAPWMDVTGCELISLGDGRFLPCDPRASGNRHWDIAFWGRDDSDRATHLLQGIFPLRRTA